MVAQYAQACNITSVADVEHKLDVLRGHCETLGRDYDAIEKTVMFPLDPGADGENIDAMLAEMQRLAGLGISHVHGRLVGVETIRPIELLGERLIPIAAAF